MAKGLMVAEFRTTQLNDQVAHSIFTQKYRARGDPFARLLELPTFGISNNHVGLQIADVLCSALLFPMASSVYCFGHVQGVHVSGRDLVVRRRYARRLKHLQFKADARWSIAVRDMHAKRSSTHLFEVPPTCPSVRNAVPTEIDYRAVLPAGHTQTRLASSEPLTFSARRAVPTSHQASGN
jgi:hypothetical protein